MPKQWPRSSLMPPPDPAMFSPNAWMRSGEKRAGVDAPWLIASICTPLPLVEWPARAAEQVLVHAAWPLAEVLHAPLVLRADPVPVRVHVDRAEQFQALVAELAGHP